jgi:hypothetical protein
VEVGGVVKLREVEFALGAKVVQCQLGVVATALQGNRRVQGQCSNNVAQEATVMRDKLFMPMGSIDSFLEEVSGLLDWGKERRVVMSGGSASNLGWSVCISLGTLRSQLGVFC